MNLFRLAALALALLTAAPAVAQFQVPDHSVPIGRGGSAQGFKNAAPGTLGYPLVSNNATSDPSFQRLPNVGLVPGAANTVKGSVDGATTSDLVLTSCSAVYQFTQWLSGTGWRCGVTPVLPSRTVAATLDLSAYTNVRTQSYATAPDGGGAQFYKLSGTQFLDQNITAGTISGNGGSGCTNGSYPVYSFSGGQGTGFMARITVAGNVVTAITKFFNAGGFGYAPGDVLATTIAGCASTVTYTVSGVTTPKASFTDAAGNKWQYAATPFLDPRQFGAKFDWLNVDATATDDYASVQAALDYASYTTSINNFIVNGAPLAGGKVLLPRGIAKINSPLTVWGSTQFFGLGPQVSGLHLADAWASGATHFVTLCDPTALVACFGVQIADMALSATQTAVANASTYMLYSNAGQQQRMINNVAIYGGKRGCFGYDTGYGGAALVASYDLFCTVFPLSASNGITINAGTTIFSFKNTIVEGSYTGNGVQVLGGQIVFDTFHTEQITTGIDVNMAVSTHSIVVKNATGGAGCTELIKLEATNTLGNFSIENAVRNGCTRMITNGQPGGANFVGDIMPTQKIISCNPGAPCN